LIKETEDCEDCELFYLQLTNYPLDLWQDNGVKVVAEDGVAAYKSHYWINDRFKNMRHTKPSDYLWTWNRQGNKLYMDGATDRTKDLFSFTIYYVRSYTLSPVANNEEFLINPSLYDPMMLIAEETAKRELKTPNDITNNEVQDGR
jgi:hypothetical protein